MEVHCYATCEIWVYEIWCESVVERQGWEEGSCDAKKMVVFFKFVKGITVADNNCHYLRYINDIKFPLTEGPFWSFFKKYRTKCFYLCKQMLSIYIFV